MTTAATSSSSSSSSRTPPPTRPSGIPDHIGAFHIGREIGKGSFAVVHKGLQIIKSKDADAQSPSSSKEIAIKIVTRRKLSPKLLENLQGEIAILKAVSHPNIIALIDCLKTDSHIYLIMDYSSGGDLSQFIRRKGSLSRHCPVTESFAAASSGYAPSPEGGLHTKVIRSFLAQLASAMQFMRVRNIVHRDIKPQNLLLQPPSPETLEAGHPAGIPQIKIADFGFARSLPAASLAETLCGSPLYMAPEILRYEKYDAKADLWSIGAVTFEMTVGKPPFRASNHIELQKKIEQNRDKIRFPDERDEESWLREVERRRRAGEDVSAEELERGPTPIDDDIKAFIRGLLKRKPVERMSFDEFFKNPIVVNNRIQTSGEQDSATQSIPSSVDPAPVSAPRDRTPLPPTPGPSLPVQTTPSSRVQAPPPTSIPPLPKFRSKYVVAQQSDSPKPSGPENHPNKSAVAASEPKTDSDSPAQPESDRYPSRLKAPNSQVTHASMSSASSAPPSSRPSPAQSDPERGQDGPGDDESQYVMIEKRNVEMNALADDLAYSPNQTRDGGGLFAGSPLAAGAVNAAARLARRPSRMSRLSSQFTAAVSMGEGGTTSAATSNAGPASNGAGVPVSPTTAASPSALKMSPSPTQSSPSAPFALPPGTRRPSFASRRTSGQFGLSPSGSASPRLAPVPLDPAGTPGSAATPNEKSDAPARSKVAVAPVSPGSALARAISQASQRWFGVPNALSLRSAAAFINNGVGAATAPKSSHAMVAATSAVSGSEQMEAVLLIHLEDLGKKAFVLCEFADSKLSAYFTHGPHQPFPYNTPNAAEEASIERDRRSSASLSSSVNSASAGAATGSSTAQAAQVANEALSIYIRSMSFLQKAVELVRGFLDARPAVGGGVTANAGLGVEVSETVQHLRRRFNEACERAEFARSRGTNAETARAQSASPDGQTALSAQPGQTPPKMATLPVANANKLIYDKAMELARSAAMDELQNNHDPVSVTHGNLGGATTATAGAGSSPESLQRSGAAGGGGANANSPATVPTVPLWDIQACLLAYETAEIMLSSLLEIPDSASDTAGGADQTLATVEPFIKSINKRTSALRKRLQQQQEQQQQQQQQRQQQQSSLAQPSIQQDAGVATQTA